MPVNLIPYTQPTISFKEMKCGQIAVTEDGRVVQRVEENLIVIGEPSLSGFSGGTGPNFRLRPLLTGEQITIKKN